MRAGVRLMDRAEPFIGEVHREVMVIEDIRERSGHLCARGDTQIRALRKQAFAVRPWRADQRNPAGERFKHTDGRDASERTRIRAAWHMDGHTRLGESRGYAVVWQPAAVFDALPTQRVLRVFGIPHAIRLRAELEL